MRALAAPRRGGWRSTATTAAAAGALVMAAGLTTDIGPWYHALNKPGWQPPDWVFGRAYTVIFALAAQAGYRAWQSAPSLRRWGLIVGLFTASVLLNIGWNTCFFTLHRPDWALGEAVPLLLPVLALVVVLRQHSRPASWLMLPYVAWVAFAAVFNLAVVQLHYPFVEP